MQNKSGFLTVVRSANNAVVFYQCKCCFSFLASTAKWDRHLSKCFFPDPTGSNNGTAPRSMGFRMVSFTEPLLRLEKVTSLQGDRTSVNAKTNDVSIIPPGLIRKRGRPPKMFVKTAVPPKTPKKRGRPRKIVSEINTTSTHLLSDNEDVMAKTIETQDGSNDTPKQPETIDDTITEIPLESSHRKSRRPKTQISYLETDDLVTVTKNKFKSKAASTSKGGKPKIGKLKRPPNPKLQPDFVRKFKHSCNLCPGKFMKEREFTIHINNVHGCKNRRLMKCCVCGRVFNKRDSLNQHYLFHESAEAREETFNLFQPWDDACIEKMRVYRAGAKYFNCQQTCKVCLLHHYSHYSFLTHFKQEHADPPEEYTLPCRFKNCSQQFKSIRVYLEHAKTRHETEYFGRLTLFRRRKGIFTGDRVVPVDEDGKLMPQLRKFPPKSAKVKKPKSTATDQKKRVSSFTPAEFAYSEDEGSDWEEENCDSAQAVSFRHHDKEGHQTDQLVRRIELESVSLVEHNIKEECGMAAGAVVSKNEVILPDIIVEDDDNERLEDVQQLESEPRAFAILKGELMY